MTTEIIQKFQPDRTLYLRGVDGAGAAAALYQTSPTGFSLSGVFRDMADFCVLVIYDADNIFEHYSVRYLPDFDVSGMVLSFDYTSNHLQPLDSIKYSWIDWGILDVVTPDGTALQVPLFQHAKLKSGTFTPASVSFNVSVPTVTTIYDRVTLFVNDASFDFVAWQGGDTQADVVANLVYNINVHKWADYPDASVAVIGTASGSTITLTYAQTGHVATSGQTVTWVDGQTFGGLAAGSQICLSGFFYTIASVDSNTQLTLTSAPDASSGGSTAASPNVGYTAARGGIDGNDLVAYILLRPGNVGLSVDKTTLPFTGGTSENLTWAVSIDFDTVLGNQQGTSNYLPINKIRQAWLTFAPQLASSGAYTDTEWDVTFSNWAVTDANNIGNLQIAGPGSIRTGSADYTCVYSANDWSLCSQNNYWRGFAQSCSALNSTVTLEYTCAQTHDLYLGTSLMNDRGTVTVAIDGVTISPSLNCYLDSKVELVTRRLVTSSVAAGKHSVTITLTGAGVFLFDYLEAAVKTPNIPDADITYSNLSPALDFDTDATYKMSPQRLLWHVRKLGFEGHMNEYLGVFWWNQRKMVNATWNAVVVTVAGTWLEKDSAQLLIGSGDATVASNYFTMTKDVIAWDTVDTIADHFVYYINSSAVAVWAEKTGTGQFTIHTRTPGWSQTILARATSTAGTMTVPSTANAVGGVMGNWQVDPSAANPLNYAVRQWHSDLFQNVAAHNMLITTSFSMELVYPPDDGTTANAWQARYYDGTPVNTDTGFASLVSSQCAFIPNMTAFQAKVYGAMAALQSAAGLTPWLQFGEFLWWFFSSASIAVYNVTGTAAAIIATKAAHNMATGDRVVITGVKGCPAVNGTWTITVIDANSFSIPVAPDGAWTANTGAIRGGSMAYYDAVTSAAAQAELGRPLYKFTCQDDDPSVNGGADTAFLAARLKLHIDSIRNAVLAQFPNAKFEVLYPYDVNHPVCLVGPGVPYSQGGRLNAAVNFPPQWTAQPTSGLDSFKVEALSWNATYMQMDRAHEAIVLALTPPMTWNPSNVAYLVPWFNATCPWPREFLLASTRGLNIVNFWAYDHLSLMSWPIPLPVSQETAQFLG